MRERLDCFLSLQQSVQYLLSPVQDFWRDMLSSGCYCYFNDLMFTGYWDGKAFVEAPKEVGVASPALSGAGSMGLAGFVAEKSAANKDHLDQCSQGSQETWGPLTKLRHLASNQLNIKILQALLSKVLIPPKEARDV